MYERIKGKPLLAGILPHGIRMRDMEKYKELFHLNKFEKEVLPYYNNDFCVVQRSLLYS